MPDENDAEKSVKKLLLKQRERVPVETSQGTFFARHMTVGDLKSFGEYFDEKKDRATTDLQALGQRLLRVLVCVDKESEKTPALTDQIYSKLSGDDLNALAAGVGKACDVTLSPDEGPLEALGSAVFDKTVEQAKQLAESQAQIRKTLESSFGSISATVKAALGENLASLSSIGQSLKTSSAVEALRKVQDERGQFFGNLAKDLAGTSPASEALRKSLEAQTKLAAGLPKDLLPGFNKGSIFSETPLPEHLARSSLFPPMEETPIGRAAIAGEKSALQLQEVSGLVGQMTEQLGKLHTLFLVDVIPQWVKNLADGAKSTNTSIGLARKAIYWSIGVTVMMTCWQVWLAREYKLENDKQQEAAEVLVRKQLEVSQELNRQLVADSRRLQEELSKLSQAVTTLQASKAPGVSRPKGDGAQR